MGYGTTREGYLGWIKRLADLYGSDIDPSDPTWREIYDCGETPETVVAEWPAVPTKH